MRASPWAARMLVALTVVAAAASGAWARNPFERLWPRHARPAAAASGWTYGKTYSSSWEEYQAMLAAAHGGTRMTWDRLPDWTGLFEHADGFNFDPQQHGFYATADLTPEYRKKYDDKLANIRKGVEWDPLSACLPAGYPRWIVEPFLREYILRPEEAWLLTEQNAEIRRIYTDGRGHVPEDEAYPLWEGDSVGFWDGDTLVAHTNHLKAGQYQRLQPGYSDQVTTVERIRKIDADTLEDIIDIYDPPALKTPWHVRHTYRRVTTPNLRINHWSCEENNNVVQTGTGTTSFALPGEAGYRDPNNRGGAPAAPPTIPGAPQ